jgi:kynurenine formamidase
MASKQISLETFRTLEKSLSNWNRWGAEDEIGTLNYITQDAVLRASKEVKEGKAFSLAISLDRKGPQRGSAGRFNPILLMTRDGGDAVSGAYPADWLEGAEKETRTTDEVIIMPTQGGTHWDSLAHVIHRQTMYNGRNASLVSSTGAKSNGIYSSRERTFGRGVLLDMPRALDRPWLKPGEGIDSEMLQGALDKQGLKIREGDILLVRTGHLAAARKRGSWDDYAGGDQPGLSIDALKWISKNRISAVANDTWGLEVQPFDVKEVHIPFHVLAIVYMGLTLGEMFDLEALAQDCAKDGRYSFFLAAQPLPFTKGVASPVNPIAIK